MPGRNGLWWQHFSEHLFAHDLAVVLEKLTPFFASRAHIDLEQPRCEMVVNEYIEPVHFEAVTARYDMLRAIPNDLLDDFVDAR